MKQLIICITTILTLLSSQSFAGHTDIAINEEISALLQTSQYQEILAEKMQETRNSNLVLHITGFSILDFPPDKIVYANFATSVSGEDPTELTPLGQIVAHVKKGSSGEIQFDGIYFKAAPGLPGGSSVGN